MLDSIKRLVYLLFALRSRIKLNRKISLIYKTLASVKVISPEKIEYHILLWEKLGSRPNLKWYKVFASINGNDDSDYVTEVDYYNKIELILNNRTFSEAYCDKNSYHNYIDNNLLPEVYLRNIQGVYYNSNYKVIQKFENFNGIIPHESDKVVVKISVDSGGGKRVELFKKNGNNWENVKGDLLTRKYLEKKFIRNFIIQEYIHQHEYYSLLNSSSVNTVRIFTYRSVVTNEIIPLQSVLRVGMPGAIVDNQASGGIACGIKEDGSLNPFAINKKGNIFYEINGIPICDLAPVYQYNEIVKNARELAGKYYYHRLIGFDFSVNNLGEVKLIEINNRNNEINFYQMNNGPLFREYTNEIIDYCLNNMKTICFDFEI